MRCPFCRENIRIQGRFCPLCGEQIFGLPVHRPGQQQPTANAPQPQPPQPVPSRPAPPRPDEADDFILDLDRDEELHMPEPTGARAPGGGGARSQAAGGDYVGKTCPYCRFPIKPGEQITICPKCDTPHHTDCWEENEGCTTYGCDGGQSAATPTAMPHVPQGGYAPQYAPSQPPTYGTPRPYAPTPRGIPGHAPVDLNALHREELLTRANNALTLSILGILTCGVTSIIGFFMAINVLSELGALRGASNHPARGRAISAIVVSFIVLLLGVVLVFGISSVE